MADEGRAARTQRGAHRELPLARGRAGDEEVPGVHARHPENEEDGCEEHPQHVANVADHALMQRLGGKRKPCFGRIGFRVIGVDLRRCRGQLPPGARKRHARAQPADHA